jgi:sugar lactone lactonase YvrE
MRFSPDGKHLGPFGDSRADRIAVDDVDHVVMIERDSPVVIIAGPDGRTLKRLEMRDAKNEFKRPVDVAVDAFGHIYVLDRDLGGVVVFTPQGQPVTTFSIPEKAPGAFRRATAMAVDDYGRLYIADERVQAVQVYQ